MAWQLVHTISELPKSPNPFVINFAFSSSKLIVEAGSLVSIGKRWHRAGYLYPVFYLPAIGHVRGKSAQVNLHIQFLQLVEIEQVSTFTLEFYSHEWLSDMKLKFWEPAP